MAKRFFQVFRGALKKKEEESLDLVRLRCKLCYFSDPQNLALKLSKLRDLLLRIGENNFFCAIRARPNLVLIYKGYLAVLFSA